MFGVLGSFIFWGIYGILSLFIGTYLLKNKAPRTYEFVTTGERYYNLDIEIPFILIACFICWPIMLLFFVLKFVFVFIFKTLLWNGMCECIKFADKAIPEISIKIGKKKK